jgi:hypothetical protein
MGQDGFSELNRDKTVGTLTRREDSATGSALASGSTGIRGRSADVAEGRGFSCSKRFRKSTRSTPDAIRRGMKWFIYILLV